MAAGSPFSQSGNLRPVRTRMPMRVKTVKTTIKKLLRSISFLPAAVRHSPLPPARKKSIPLPGLPTQRRSISPRALPGIKSRRMRIRKSGRIPSSIARLNEGTCSTASICNMRSMCTLRRAPEKLRKRKRKRTQRCRLAPSQRLRGVCGSSKSLPMAAGWPSRRLRFQNARSAWKNLKFTPPISRILRPILLPAS